MLTPSIIGIACTDESGRLFYEDGEKKRLIARHPNVPKWVAPLDFSLLKKFLNKYWADDTLIVIGANTFRESEKLLMRHYNACRSTIMISHSDHYCFSDVPDKQFPYLTDNSLEGLRIAARQVSADHDIKRVLVLGGRSVYNAFASNYDHFTHCKVATKEMTAGTSGGETKISSLVPYTIRGLAAYNETTAFVEKGYSVTHYDRVGCKSL